MAGIQGLWQESLLSWTPVAYTWSVDRHDSSFFFFFFFKNLFKIKKKTRCLDTLKEDNKYCCKQVCEHCGDMASSRAKAKPVEEDWGPRLVSQQDTLRFFHFLKIAGERLLETEPAQFI